MSKASPRSASARVLFYIHKHVSFAHTYVSFGNIWISVGHIKDSFTHTEGTSKASPRSASTCARLCITQTYVYLAHTYVSFGNIYVSFAICRCFLHTPKRWVKQAPVLLLLVFCYIYTNTFLLPIFTSLLKYIDFCWTYKGLF